MLETLLIGALATIVGVAAGNGDVCWIVDVSMRETMPDLGTLISMSAATYALAAGWHRQREVSLRC